MLESRLFRHRGPRAPITEHLKGWFGFGKKHLNPTVQRQHHTQSMKRMAGEDEPFLLPRRQAPADEIEVKLFVTSIELVANDRMPQMGQVDPDLMLPASFRFHFQQGELPLGTTELLQQSVARDSRRTICADTILDGGPRGNVLSQRNRNAPGFRAHLAVNNRQIALANSPSPPSQSQHSGHFGGLGHKSEARGLPVQTIDQVPRPTEVKAHTPHQT